MKVSFCTTCKGRLQHLQQTLPQNLRDNPNEDGLEIEFVILNYGDNTGMHEWMTTDPLISSEIEAGRVVYARTQQPVFRMAHAKNMAHRLATGDVVCNVDADNFTGSGFAQALARRFEKTPNIVINPSYSITKDKRRDASGLFGRMAIMRDTFDLLGGYDETYQGWGGEDTNLTRRARLMGIRYVRFDDWAFLNVIPHENAERVANMFQDESDRQRELEKIEDYKNSRKLRKIWNASRDRLPLFFKPLIANSGSHFGLGHIDFLNTEHVDSTIAPQQKRVPPFTGLRKAWYLRNLCTDRIAPHTIRLSAPTATI